MCDEMIEVLEHGASSIPTPAFDGDAFVARIARRQHQQRMTLRAATITGAVAAVSATMVMWPSATPPALAGWTTEPQPVSDEVNTRMSDSCAWQGHTPEDWPARLTELVESPGEPDLIDKRGGAAVSIWRHVEGSEAFEFVCRQFDTDGDGLHDFGGSSASIGAAEVGPASYGGGSSQSGDHSIQMWSGVVPDNVEEVVAVREDGTEVEASLNQDGLFLVWWPDRGTPTELHSIRTLDRAGTVTDEWFGE